MTDKKVKKSTITESNIKTRFKPNTSGNPKGLPKGTRTKPKSKLRTTLAALQAMEEDALKNIKENIKRKDVDKEVLATSKWLISSIISVNRAAAADEANILAARVHSDEMKIRAEEKREATNGNVIRARFSTYMDNDDEEEEE